jgi:hypothetical protein
MSHIRTTPINAYARELLTGTQELLEGCLDMHSDEIFRSEFPDISTDALETLNHVSQCASYMVCLMHAARNSSLALERRNDASRAAQVFGLEMQRQLGHLFPMDHPFWLRFYDRHNKALRYDRLESEDTQEDQSMHHIRNRYAAFFVPLDCLHYLTNQINYTSYELISQSVGWVLAGYYAPNNTADTDITQVYRKALRLVDRMNLPAYKKCVAEIVDQHLQHTRSDSRDKINA